MGFVLAAVEFLDEFAGGLPVVGAGAVRDTLQSGVFGLTLVVLAAPMLLSWCVEAPLLLWAERRPRAPMIALGLLGMALALVGAACAPPGPWLLPMLALYHPASGLACGLTQAALMDADPERREQRMAHWTLAGMLGDLATPVWLALAELTGMGWRVAWVVVAVLLLLQALVLLRCQHAVGVSAAAQSEPTEESNPERRVAIIRRAIRATRNAVAMLRAHPQLAIWLVGVTLCSLMDETLVALTALWLRERQAGPGVLAAILSAFTLGGVLGLVALPHVLRRVKPRQVLAVACAGCTLCYLGWIWSSTASTAITWMLLVGAFAAVHYPLATAQAYRSLPQRSGLVVAAGQLFVPLDAGMVLALGWVADELGVALALGALVLQPLGLLCVVLVVPRVGPAPPSVDPTSRG